ncbi:MAG: DEAD/DEAH box helicase [Anaerolineae bacterium]|nr:DEAD/DEAH box helicase [Gemmatimonadaceae bacterium]
MVDVALPSTDGFESLGLSGEVAATLVALGYEEPTPIQLEAIPPLLAGRDLLGQAATGTGKTAAFALPLIQQLTDDPDRRRDKQRVRALILVPTRELAMQVAQAIHKYGRSIGARVLPIYGGQSIHQQLVVLRRGVAVPAERPCPERFLHSTSTYGKSSLRLSRPGRGRSPSACR